MKLISNKNITSLLTLTSCLVILSSGASCFASYASLPEESFSSSSSVQTVQSGGQKSLGEFVQVLGKRLSGVWQEVWGLVGGSGGTTSSSTSSPTVLVDALLSGSQQLPNYFTDAGTSPHAYFINLLAKEGIVVGQQGKFYPDNYLRLYDLIKMSVDLYRSKVGYSLTGGQGLLQEGAFPGDTGLSSRYVATALHLGFLSHVTADYTGMEGVERFVSSQDMTQLFTNIGYEFSGMVRNIPLATEETVTRGDAAMYLVMAFGITPSGFIPYQTNQPIVQLPFSDIFGNQYQAAISTLAQLGIVDMTSAKFYPDNDLHRSDFIIMLVNSLLYSHHQLLDIRYMSSNYVSPFADVGSDKSYAPFVYYAQNQGLLDYLTVTKREQNYLLPDSMMTKHEIYSVLGKALGTKFIYDSVEADKVYMTRGEFAQILVDAFGFAPPIQTIGTSSVQNTGSGTVVSVLLQVKDLLSKI